MWTNDTTSKNCKKIKIDIIEHRGWVNTKLMQNWGWAFSLKYCKIPYPPNWLSKNKSFKSILLGALRMLKNWYPF
jgi:hypothetical protein